MKIYKVKVNGKFYEVILEEVSEVPTGVESKGESTTQDTSLVKSPMQGVILDIVTNVGAKVNKGDKLLILEAMKMENDILAPNAGTVKKIYVNKGQTVNLNDILVEIE